MMRRIVLSVAAVLLSSFFAVVCEASPQIYKSNVLTAQHVAVPGTHVAVVPPPGAAPATSFRGFEIASRGITYEIVEKMGAPYSASEAELTGEALLAQGIKVLDTTRAVLNEKPASLLTCRAKREQPDDGGGDAEDGLLLLVFGDDRLTVFIYGYYPLSDGSALSALRTSMLSAIFEPKQKENSGGGYTLSSSGTAFKFAGESNMTRHYTVGDAPAGAELDTAVYSSVELKQSVSPENRESFAKETLASYLSQYEYELSSQNRINYGGLEGIELTASFDGAVRRSRTSSGGIVRRAMAGVGYQTVLFGQDGRVFVFQGAAVRDAESYLAQFRKITSTFALQK